MATKLYVRSQEWAVNDDQLAEFFSAVGTVESAKVVVDRDTGRSKGFGFVEMSTDDEAKKAVDELNGKDLAGRPVSVNEARPREERPRRDFGGNGGGNSY
jgi:RNA recognition motif-containing protein